MRELQKSQSKQAEAVPAEAIGKDAGERSNA
jgi:hypothetical protein